MKTIKWKILVITCITCLLPILLGLSLWNELPDSIAIHFNFHGEPNHFASKAFGVFGLPTTMMLLQAFCCIVTDLKAEANTENRKYDLVLKWILPVLAILLQTVTLLYALEWDIDIRKCIILIISAMFLVLGNCMPKLTYTKHGNTDAENAQKINRFLGYETIIMGILGLITVFLPAVASVIWLILLIPYGLIAAIYSIKVSRTA